MNHSLPQKSFPSDFFSQHPSGEFFCGHENWHNSFNLQWIFVLFVLKLARLRVSVTVQNFSSVSDFKVKIFEERSAFPHQLPKRKKLTARDNFLFVSSVLQNTILTFQQEVADWKKQEHLLWSGPYISSKRAGPKHTSSTKWDY